MYVLGWLNSVLQPQSTSLIYPARVTCTEMRSGILIVEIYLSCRAANRALGWEPWASQWGYLRWDFSW